MQLFVLEYAMLIHRYSPGSLLLGLLMSPERKVVLMGDLPAPYPCGQTTHICPYTLRCREIDEYALLISGAEAFANAAAAEAPLFPSNAPPQVLALARAVGLPIRPAVFWNKPSRRFREEGGCPSYVGHLNGGAESTVVCALVSVQLHDYCELKFCEKGRKVYCPIWREKGVAYVGDHDGS